jgi:hypothetical protein
VADDHYFYILANKKEGKLGFYLYKLDFNKPYSDKGKKESDYLIRWNNKLDIADADVALMEEKDKETGLSIPGMRYIVCSYKMIGINTYNIFVIDIESEDHLI